MKIQETFGKIYNPCEKREKLEMAHDAIIVEREWKKRVNTACQMLQSTFFYSLLYLSPLEKLREKLLSFFLPFFSSSFGRN